jgi:hypothetical protein
MDNNNKNTQISADATIPPGMTILDYIEVVKKKIAQAEK